MSSSETGCFSFSSMFSCIRFRLPSRRRDHVKKRRNWGSGIPQDILEDISDRLPLLDFVMFRGVCRHWRYAPSGRSNITSFSKNKEPWLLFYGFQGKTTCYLYSYPNPNCCTIRLPDLKDAMIISSKCNWFVVRRKQHLFLYNPFTFAKIDLPDHEEVEEKETCTITALPPSNGTIDYLSNYTIIIQSVDFKDYNCRVSFCNIGDTEWKRRTESSTHYENLRDLSPMFVCECSSDAHLFGSCKIMDNRYAGAVEITRLQWKYYRSGLYDRDWLDRFGAGKEMNFVVPTAPLDTMGSGHIIGGEIRFTWPNITKECRTVYSAFVDPILV